MTGTAVVSPAAFRSRFPVLDTMTHLASCSLGPRSAALDAALARMLDLLAGDATPWDQWYAAVQRSRQRFAALIGAPVEHVAVVPSATIGAYQVASTMDWSARPRVVTSDAEYPSVAQVWLAQRSRGAEPAMAAEAEGFAEPALSDRTGLVSVPVVSYRTGAVLPVAEVAARAHAVGARVFVDAYQAAGVVPVNVTELDCDYLVSGVMKYLLGLPGIAFLYARDGGADLAEPPLTGFYGRADPLAFDPADLSYPPDARRFQMNLPTLPAALAADAGLGLIAELDPVAVERHVTGLAGYAIDRLGLTGAVPGPQLAVPDPDPAGLARWLNDRRIFPARGVAVRLSFHYFNTESDVDITAAAVDAWRAR